MPGAEVRASLFFSSSSFLGFGLTSILGGLLTGLDPGFLTTSVKPPASILSLRDLAIGSSLRSSSLGFLFRDLGRELIPAVGPEAFFSSSFFFFSNFSYLFFSSFSSFYF